MERGKKGWKSRKDSLHDGKSACRLFCFSLGICQQNTGHLKIRKNKKNSGDRIELEV